VYAHAKTVRQKADRKRNCLSAVHGSVRPRARLAARWAGRGIFKGAALVAAFALIVVVWLWDAALLTETADYNLWLVKRATGVLPGDWPSKVESALRMFGADRALLLTEAVLLAKMVMVAAGYPFVLAGRGVRARWRRRRAMPTVTEGQGLVSDRRS
jgi:hypothetical protein